MRLRGQLVLVSLVILALPWAGCQSVRQMEAALREGQGNVLLASAQAIAARLESERTLIAAHDSEELQHAGQQLYLHPLAGTPIVDGYGEDWTALTIAPRQFGAPDHDFSAQLWAGLRDNTVYVYLRVNDDDRDYHRLGSGEIANGDHLILRTLSQTQDVASFYLRTTGPPGNITAAYVNHAGAIRQEHRIRGQWRETPQGYDIEAQLPLSVIGDTLDFSLVDRAPAQSSIQIGTHVKNEWPPPWVSAQVELQRLLAPFAKNRLQIDVVNRRGWLMAHAGSGDDSEMDFGREAVAPSLRQWFYCLALRDRQFPILDDPRASGRMDSGEIARALKGQQAVHWYQRVSYAWYQCLSERVGRAAVPIALGGDVIGVVAVSQSTDSLLGVTNSAFSRLFYYSLLTVALVGSVLFTYASWLSLRIRRLSRAADEAIGSDGKIRPAFLRSKAQDEIGDLTRSYGSLLERLRDYTEYLRTLASKLSHELRTPLAVVRSSLENLEYQSQSETSREYAQRAKEGAERLAHILNAMSAANRVEESIQQTQLEVFALDDLLRDLTAAYGDAYANSTIVCDIADDVRGYRMQGAPDLLVQMLDKLVDNAADFCPSDGTITLALSRGKEAITLAVRNTGPLLPEHMHGQLFDSLVSLREGPKQGMHLGLGLYIVRLIVDFHGGRVMARNLADGSGVEFIVRLPAQN